MGVFQGNTTFYRESIISRVSFFGKFFMFVAEEGRGKKRGKFRLGGLKIPQTNCTKTSRETKKKQKEETERLRFLSFLFLFFIAGELLFLCSPEWCWGHFDALCCFVFIAYEGLCAAYRDCRDKDCHLLCLLLSHCTYISYLFLSFL